MIAGPMCQEERRISCYLIRRLSLQASKASQTMCME
uniref:Uncharacterized protein n=1 Tax=Arundo donax TaxID=35708 RepID=A0A0A9EY46_ARUDO